MDVIQPKSFGQQLSHYLFADPNLTVPLVPLFRKGIVGEIRVVGAVLLQSRFGRCLNGGR